MFYLIATPIGNLEDITLRALRVLKSVDCIFCEDTRVTQKLLQHYKIRKALVSYHAHSKFKRLHYLLQLLRQGKEVAYITDAGTPGISDPGVKIVQWLRNKAPEIEMTSIPGPSALAMAASLSAFSMNKFLFLGFLPRKKGRKRLLESWSELEYPIVFYESPYRIKKTLAEIAEILADLEVEVFRELTKRFETIYRGKISAVLKQLPEKVKGELVVIINRRK